MKETAIDPVTEEALRKFKAVSLLVEEGLSAPELTERRCAVLSEENISPRTLRRWVADYKRDGFNGLLRHERIDKGKSKSITDEVLAKAEQYRKELPRRSAGLICELLESEGHKVARSTLERVLRVRGLSGRQLAKEAKRSPGTRRFVRIGRNTLWQADIKYGPYVQSPKNPQKRIRTYLLAIIDDATRFVVHGEFYADQKQPILEDSLRKAILRNGSPAGIYVDNGKIFVSHWLQLACARLNIRHLKTQPYSPEAKGKIERLNRTVESFLAEYAIQKSGTLAELNQLFEAWLSEGYNNKPHSSLDGRTPAEVFREDKTPLRFHNIEALRDAFLHEEERSVDKTGCLKLCGITYDAGVDFTRKKVVLHFDPFDMGEIQLWHKGKFMKRIRESNPGEFNGTQRVTCDKIEERAQSRVLEKYKKDQQERFTNTMGAFRLRAETEQQ
jgi:transposase InsO family protein